MASINATTARAFVELLSAGGFDYFVGVPCSTLDGVIREVLTNDRIRYVPAVREDLAVGLAAGAQLAGRSPVVFMQNSALGVCLNAITSLAVPYRIPLLLLVSWRGYRGNDSPEHELTGESTPAILDAIGIRHIDLDASEIAKQLQVVTAHLRQHHVPIAVTLRKGVLH